MSTTIAVPLWLALLLALLAAWALLDRLLLPSVRWLIRSRANRVLDEVGTRLRIQIRPFQQTSRRALIDRLVFDDKVQQAAREFAEAQSMPREVAQQVVESYASEIVPAFNAYFYFRIGYWIGKRVSRLLYRVRIGYSDEAGLAAVPADATVVFVMNHRSNMDYVLTPTWPPRRRRCRTRWASGRASGRCSRSSARWARTSCGAARATRCTVGCSSATSRWPPRPASRRPSTPRAG